MASRFVVAGARKDTGVDQELVVEADDAGQAEQIAGIRGLLVSSVRSADAPERPVPIPPQSAITTEPARLDPQIARRLERDERDKKRTFLTMIGWGLLAVGVVSLLSSLTMHDRGNNFSNSAPLVGFLGVVLAIAGIVVLFSSNRFQESPVPASNVLSIPQEEFNAQMGRIAQGKLPVIDDVDIPIHSGEVCHLEIVSTLVTPTKQRVIVGGHSHGFFAAVPVSLRGNAFTRGVLYLTSDRLVFIAADNSVTETWKIKQVVDASYVRTQEGCSGMTISTTLKRDAGKSFWFDGPQEAQIAALVIRKAVECYA